MDTTKCISDKQWEDYSQKLSGEDDLSMIHAHVKTCEICADIKQGIDLMVKPEKLKDRVEWIREETDKRTQTKGARFIPLFYWSAAAAVLLVASWFILKTDSQLHPEMPMAQVTTPADTSGLAAKNDTPIDNHQLAMEEPVRRSRKEIEPAATPATAGTEAAVVMEPATTMKAESVTANETADAKQESDQVTATTKALQEEKVPQARTLQNVEPAKETESKKRFKATQKETLPANYSNRAYDNSFQNNQVNFDDTFSPEDSSLFENARRCFQQSKWDSCERLLPVFLRNTSGRYYEEALWMKASILHINGKPEAGNLLRTIIRMKGRYAEKAEALLKQ